VRAAGGAARGAQTWQFVAGRPFAQPWCRGEARRPPSNTSTAAHLPPAHTRKLCRALEAAARRRGHAFSYSDHVHLSLGWGAGHAACHALFFFASLLPLTTGGGSLYLPACPAMSVFTLSAINTLGSSATLAAAMVVALEGWRRRRADEIVFAPAVHAAAGLLVGGGRRTCMGVWGSGSSRRGELANGNGIASPAHMHACAGSMSTVRLPIALPTPLAIHARRLAISNKAAACLWHPRFWRSGCAALRGRPIACGGTLRGRRRQHPRRPRSVRWRFGETNSG
jgi:hypothetical protein